MPTSRWDRAAAALFRTATTPSGMLAFRPSCLWLERARRAHFALNSSEVAGRRHAVGLETMSLAAERKRQLAIITATADGKSRHFHPPVPPSAITTKRSSPSSPRCRCPRRALVQEHLRFSASFSFMVLAPPPTDALFPSRETLLAHVRDFGAAQGYAVVIQKSNVPRGQLWLRCDLGPGRRHTRRQQLHDCPFQLYARRLPSGHWTLKVQHAAHNHEAESLALHPVARRLTLEHKRLVRELTDGGLRPARILERLREQFPGKPFNIQEIYNARNFIRRERLAGRAVFVDEQKEEKEEKEQEATSADVVPVLPPVVKSTETADPNRVLHELWGRVSDQFTNWQPEVQEKFVLQLDRLVETCNRQNEDVNAGGSTARMYSEVESGELGGFDGQEVVADAFLRGGLVDTSIQGFDASMPSGIELQQVVSSPGASAVAAGDISGEVNGDKAADSLINDLP